MNELEKDDTPGPIKKVMRWIAGITAVLIVIPALINAGSDIYASILKIPRSDTERANKALFEKHFGKAPLFHGDVPVKTEIGLVNMVLEVHEGGDIFVRYGKHSQWFPCPLVIQEKSSLFGNNAYAEYLAMQQTNPNANYQYDTMLGSKIQRELYFQDGTKETYLIDLRTGYWDEPSKNKYQEVPKEAIPTVDRFEFPVIDLTNPKKPSEEPNSWSPPSD
jgi:hypothetical protein